MVDMSALQGLRRSTADRKLTGLCGGVAQQWRIDPLLVRILAVLLVLSGGIGLVLYAFGWLMVPEEGSTERAAHRLVPQSKNWSKEIWIAILVVAGIACVALLGQFVPLGLMPALIILAVWYFGFRKPNSSTVQQVAAPPPAHDPLAGPSTPFTDAARAWQERMAQYPQRAPQANQSPDQPPSQPGERWTAGTNPTTPWPIGEPSGPAERLASTSPFGAPNPNLNPHGDEFRRPISQSGPTADGFYSLPDPAGIYTPPTGEAAAATSVPAPTLSSTTSVATRRPPRPRPTPAAKRLRLVVLIVAGLALAGLGLADALGAPITAVMYLAASLLVVGLGLVVAAWVGRARGLLPIGILLLLATVLTQAGTSTAAQYGDQWTRQELTYSTLAELPTTDTFEVGTYVIDLGGLAVRENRTYQVSLEVGQLSFTIPADQRVRVEAATDIGAIDLPDNHQSGPDISAARTYGPNDPKLPLLTIKVRVDAGTITVTR